LNGKEHVRLNPPSDGNPGDLALIRQGFALSEVFSSWPSELLARLLPASRLRRHARADLVHSEADGEPQILIVVAGHLMVERIGPDGSCVPIAILGPGFVAGIARGLTPGDQALHSYRAHGDAVVIHLPAPVVFRTLGTDVLLWKTMARALSRQHRQIFTTVLDQLTGSTRRRLAAAIAGLTRVHGVEDGSRRLRLRLSQVDLAAMLQVTRRSINKEMRVLESMALVRSEYNGVVVLDLPTLSSLGQSTAGSGAWMALRGGGKSLEVSSPAATPSPAQG
jgi:CRP/FNR family cyclic AMP-dependent transcriptional regulator